jgi:hypothetical protein
MHVLNDTSKQVSLSSCGLDPTLSSPKEVTVVYGEKNDPNVACIVSSANSGDMIGCLRVPTTVYGTGDTIKLSRLQRGVSASKCGDG